MKSPTTITAGKFRSQNENPDFYRFYDQHLVDDSSILSPSPERVKQEGYWFWSEFIAQAIAFYVDEQHSLNENAGCQSDENVWTPYEWNSSSVQLRYDLKMVFHQYPTTIDEAALAMYFSMLLMHSKTKQYVAAAKAGRLNAFGRNSMQQKEFNEIEATGISDVNKAYQEILLDMKGKLECQLEKERFWEIEENFLEELGNCIMMLMLEKLLLISGKLLKQ